MGVQKATHAYAQIYGHNDKRVLRTDNPPPPPEADVIALLDMPTYHIPTVSSLAAKTAVAVNNNGSKLGQLVLFCNIDNVIHDSLFDANMCLSQEDVDTVVSEIEHVNSVKNYKLSFCSMNRSFMESFSSKVKKWIRPQCNDMRVVLVQVVFPHGCVDKLKSFISGFPMNPEVAMQLSGSGDAARGNCCGHEAFREWLNLNKVKEGKFINFDHVYNAICGSKTSSENYKYGCAVMTQSMEGILLTYGHFMVSKIKKLLSNRFVKRKHTAAANNSAVLFYDGKPPVIKNYRRFKREQARRQRLKNKDNEISERITPEMMIKEVSVLCEKALLMIPQCIYRVALLDVFRLPLYEQLNIDDLFLSITDGSEAEDDMVRLTAFAANMNTGIRGDKKNLLKLGRGDPRRVKSGIFSNNYLKTNVDWITVCTETLFKNAGTSVDMYSSDSDVIAKWDSLVRHAAESPHDLRGLNDDDLSARMKKVAGKIKSIFFFRSLVNKGRGMRDDSRAVYATSSDDDDNFTLGKRRIVALDDDDDDNGFGSPYSHGIRNGTNNSFDIYDLTQSPVLRSVESTLQLMVVNGCDYVDPLVSPETASKFDVQIREEISLFENYACMCVMTKEDNEKFRLLSYKQNQLQLRDRYHCQRESVRCLLCDKTKVPEFIEVKRFFVNRANHEYSKFPKAVNAAANIMSLLSLSCFNQKIFGSISRTSDKNNTKSVEVSSLVRKAKNVFFCEHTQGGIPTYGDCAVAYAINKDRTKIFKYLGIDEYMKGVPSRRDYMIKNSEAFIQGNKTKNRKFRFNLGNLLAKHDKRLDKEETIQDILSFEMYDRQDNDVSIITDIWFDGEEANEETTTSTTTNTFVVKKESVNIDKDYQISKLLQEEENTNGRLIVDDVSPPCALSYHNRENIHNIELIGSAMASSATGTEDYILSRLTNILRSNFPTRGIDDVRSKRMSYSEKVMDLLVIVYLNICGLQDPASDHMYREDGSTEQYVPIIHTELYGNPSGTTRNYFIAALYEMSLAMYRYGLSEGCSLPQTRRQNRNVINERLHLYDKEMSLCEVEVFNQDIKAVYGAARVKPWSTLALLGAKLFYEARIHNFSKGYPTPGISE